MPASVFNMNVPGKQYDPAGHKYVGIMRPAIAHTRPAGHITGEVDPNPGHIVPAVHVAHDGAPEVN
jgi:hypothetical protein